MFLMCESVGGRRYCYTGSFAVAAATMTETLGLKTALKRGALLALANWPLVTVQFIAESTFKIALAVPVVGGMLLVMLLAGDVVDPFGSLDLRERAAAIAGALFDTPAALAAFVAAFGVVLLGGSALLFLIKGGTMTVMIESERSSGAIERPPLRWEVIGRTGRCSIDTFVAGCTRLFRRYLRLGLILIGVYTVTGAAYLAVMFVGFPASTHPGILVGWTIFAALISGALVVWITLVNLMYLLIQIIVALEDVGIRQAARRVTEFLRGAFREVAGVFGVVLVLVVLATIVSILATAGLGLISFVPFAGLAVLPLQLAAWLVRGMVFQYLGLTSLGAYLTEYRAYTNRAVKLRIA
jgi:hypothetical protein